MRMRVLSCEIQGNHLGLWVGIGVLGWASVMAYKLLILGLTASAFYLWGLIQGRTIVVYESETHIVEPVELPVCEPLSI